MRIHKLNIHAHDGGDESSSRLKIHFSCEECGEDSLAFDWEQPPFLIPPEPSNVLIAPIVCLRCGYGSSLTVELTKDA